MKRLVCLICGCCLLVSVFAQNSTLAIATDKTTSLIFPFPVRHVDRGTKEVLVQQVKEAGNILLVKAASEKFPETNLSVITEDGSVYTFRVSYATDPSTWVWHIPPQHSATLASYANGLMDKPAILHGIRDRRWDMETKVTGIYIKGNVIFYQLRLDNQSPVDYDVELLKFYIRDQQKGKRTATQETELVPLHVAGNTTQVKANTTNTVVVALDKFTIPNRKYFAIQIMERNGGRHLMIKVHNNKIVKARILPELH